MRPEILFSQGALVAATAPSVWLVQLPYPAVAIGAGDTMNIARFQSSIRPTNIKHSFCFRAFD